MTLATMRRAFDSIIVASQGQKGEGQKGVEQKGLPRPILVIIDQYLNNYEKGTVTLDHRFLKFSCVEEGRLYTRQWNNIRESFLAVCHSLPKRVPSIWPIRAFLNAQGQWKKNGDAVYVIWNKDKFIFTICFNGEETAKGGPLHTLAAALDYRARVTFKEDLSQIEQAISHVTKGGPWIIGQTARRASL